MEESDVIGLTTTACASRWEVFDALEPEVLICEEAGEVTEAHTMCSLFPTLKHSIFIGDPLQLRPGVREPLMTLETRSGSSYRLDESLFERIMMPRNPLAPTFPTSQLDLQRRMHPQLARLSHITYPFLSDHQSTTLHPPPKGVGNRMYWLDHRVPEVLEPEALGSVSNPHEIDLVQALVQYLLSGSGYSYGDICVLTPYAAQLAKMHAAFQATCSIWLSEQDREVLMEAGRLEPEAEIGPGRTKLEMGDMLRIATIDNFQGEEAKVVILSTVRSGGKVGFLSSRNRINVACSRARNGFYIVGNADTLSQVDMWKQIIGVFKEQGLIGPALPLQCDRHPCHKTNATSVADFAAFEDCTEVCGATLACGHLCLEPCHEPELHAWMPCQQQCEK